LRILGHIKYCAPSQRAPYKILCFFRFMDAASIIKQWNFFTFKLVI